MHQLPRRHLLLPWVVGVLGEGNTHFNAFQVTGTLMKRWLEYSHPSEIWRSASGQQTVSIAPICYE